MASSHRNALTSTPVRKAPGRSMTSQFRAQDGPRARLEKLAGQRALMPSPQGPGNGALSLAKGAPLDIAGGEWCLRGHEHRCPREPSLVAHLVKVAGAISFSPIVRGRHRSATAFSFVLCGVSSASFVRGSHEQDSLLPAGL